MEMKASSQSLSFKQSVSSHFAYSGLKVNKKLLVLFLRYTQGILYLQKLGGKNIVRTYLSVYVCGM